MIGLLSYIVPIIAQAETAPASPPAGPGGSGLVMQLVMFGLLFAGMWFLLIAPQRKKQKEHQKMLSELKAGDDVVTFGGIFGTITNVKGDRFVLKIAENTKIEVAKGYVMSKADKAVEPPPGA